MRRATLVLTLPLLTLAACDRGEHEAVDTRPQPVLEGTISDAMLQTDELKAQAPLGEPVASASPAEDASEGSAPKLPPKHKPSPRKKASEDRPDRAKASDSQYKKLSAPSPSPVAPRAPRPTAPPPA